IPGKPIANDLRAGKVTLPLIYALEQMDQKKVKPYREILANGHFTKYNVQRMYKFAINSGGLEYLSKKMDEYKDKALLLLSELPKSEARESLRLCLEYVANRSV
ncbi:MAG: polyprenyl synthetase family protein, partial [Bacteroidales bacterium]